MTKNFIKFSEKKKKKLWILSYKNQNFLYYKKHIEFQKFPNFVIASNKISKFCNTLPKQKQINIIRHFEGRLEKWDIWKKLKEIAEVEEIMTNQDLEDWMKLWVFKTNAKEAL